MYRNFSKLFNGTFKNSKHFTHSSYIVPQALGRTIAVVFFRTLNGQFTVYGNFSQHNNIKL